MNEKLLNIVKAHWWKLVGVLFMAWGAWTMLKADVKNLKVEMPEVKTEVALLKEFRSAQMVVNTTTEKKLDKMDDKLDKILYRLPRR